MNLHNIFLNKKNTKLTNKIKYHILHINQSFYSREKVEPRSCLGNFLWRKLHNYIHGQILQLLRPILLIQYFSQKIKKQLKESEYQKLLPKVKIFISLTLDPLFW